MAASPKRPDLDILDIECSDVAVAESPRGASVSSPSSTALSTFDAKDKQLVAMMVAIGEPTEQVAGKLGIDKLAIERFLKSAEGTEQVIRFQTAMFPDPTARIKRTAHLAIDASMRLLLRGSSEATIAKVAADLLDRANGKAVQLTENRNLNINISDMAAADRALEAQNERLKRLEETAEKLKASYEKKK